MTFLLVWGRAFSRNTTLHTFHADNGFRYSQPQRVLHLRFNRQHGNQPKRLSWDDAPRHSPAFIPPSLHTCLIRANNHYLACILYSFRTPSMHCLDQGFPTGVSRYPGVSRNKKIFKLRLMMIINN
jgi:hypothetical protein